MPDILHKVGIKSSSLDNVYKALATVEGLSQLVDVRHARRKQGRWRTPVPLR